MKVQHGCVGHLCAQVEPQAAAAGSSADEPQKPERERRLEAGCSMETPTRTASERSSLYPEGPLVPSPCSHTARVRVPRFLSGPSSPGVDPEQS